MAVALYLDVHVPIAIAVQLRRRSVDVLTAVEDGWQARSDDELLERATTIAKASESAEWHSRVEQIPF